MTRVAWPGWAVSECASPDRCIHFSKVNCMLKVGDFMVHTLYLGKGYYYFLKSHNYNTITSP